MTRLVGEVGHRFGVDMCAGPIPRMGADDVRVGPGRRNYFSRAELASMPVGVWMGVGPYSSAEWAARGRDGVAGRASFCKVTERSYVALYELGGDEWRWSLETVGRGQHRGLWAEGVASSEPQARTAARSEVQRRWPDEARVLVAPSGVLVVDPSLGWVRVDDGGSRTEQRVFDDRVSALIAPGPGGRWVGFVHLDGVVDVRCGLTDSRDEAVRTADRAAAQVMRRLGAEIPARADELVMSAATTSVNGGGGWDRSVLADLVAPTLSGDDANRLLDGRCGVVELVELLLASGRVGPATALAVARADGFDVSQVVETVSVCGLPRSQAVAEIARRWDTPVEQVAAMAGLSVSEFAELGPSSRQLLAFAPRAGLRSIGLASIDWYSAGQDLVAVGYSVPDALRQVAAHGVSPEAIAAGVAGVTEDLEVVVPVLAGEVTPVDLVAVGAWFGTDPVDLVAMVNRSGVGLAPVVAVALELCDGDRPAAWKLLGTAIAASGGVMPAVELFTDLADGRAPTVSLVDTRVVSNVIEVDFTR